MKIIKITREAVWLRRNKRKGILLRIKQNMGSSVPESNICWLARKTRECGNPDCCAYASDSYSPYICEEVEKELGKKRLYFTLSHEDSGS